MVVYLIHFAEPIGSAAHSAQHYLGVTSNLKRRIARHHAGNGSRIMAHVTHQGIGWQVARTWEDASPELEKRLKSWHKARQLCPICREQE